MKNQKWIFLAIVGVLLLLAGCEQLTTLPPPFPPSDLIATSISPTEVVLQWKDNSPNERYFRVYRKTTDRYARIAVLNPDTSSYTDSSASPGTTYWYEVRTYNSGGESEPSNEASATTSCVGSIELKAPFVQVWIAVITSIADLDWDTAFIDRDSGIIRFKTSYMYSNLFESRYFRIYQWPKKYEADYSHVDKRVQRLSTCPKLTFDHYVFSKENLNIQIIQMDKDSCKVRINFTVEGFSNLLGFKPGNSNGTFEEMLVSKIRQNLI